MSKTARRSRGNCSLRWRSRAPSTSGWRCRRRASTGRYVASKDFERFAGEVVDITLKAPMGAAADGQVAANRKKFRGTLERADGGRLADRLER